MRPHIAFRSRFVCFLSFLLLASLPLRAQSTSPAEHKSSAPPDLISLPPEDASHEDFADPKLRPGDVQQTLSVMIERAELPDYTRELWRLQWRKGDPIDLYIILPKQSVKPAAILYLYGFPADTDRFRDDTYCKTVTARGLAAIGFVSALTGQRYHDRPWKEWFLSDLQEGIGASAHDVQMIVNFLETRPYLDAHRLGMFGQGSGATIAALAAASDLRLRAVDLLDPWGDWPIWLQQSAVISEKDRATFTSKEFLAGLTQLDPINRLAAFPADKVRLQQTGFDAVTPQAVQTALAAKMPPGATVVRYASVEDYATRASSGGKILDWLSGQLTK